MHDPGNNNCPRNADPRNECCACEGRDVNDVLRALLKGQPGVRHEKMQAKVVDAHYHQRGGAQTGQWKDLWECPECHRQTRQLNNYLGGRSMWCDGIRWFKEGRMRPCNCGSGLPSRELSDARGIYCGRVCDKCEREKRAGFRPEIFTDANYETSEPIEEDE